MGEMMTFPKTVEEFMEQYKITDTEQVYTNGIELVPIFRMEQWFDHEASAKEKKEWIFAKKHLFRKDEYGNNDEMAFCKGFHNGVICMVCEESICIHCQPDYENDECRYGHYICPKCGSREREPRNYCPECGIELVAPKEEG